jgi:F-type H+-transporting ATPase subunit delta
MAMQEDIRHDTALDSDQRQVGRLYAKALLGAAAERVDSVVSELEAIVTECLDKYPHLETALGSPRITEEQKEGMLERIFQGKVDRTLLNFLKVLCRRGRIGSLRSIQATATEMREEQLGRQRIQVTSALPLDDAQRAAITAAFNAAYGKQALLLEKVDPGLLGGIVLRIGDQVLDGSLLGRLDSLRAAVAGGIQKAIRDRYESLMSS